jgi:GxxExxY protein
MHADATQIGTDTTDLNAITELIIGRAYVVSNTLRTGFLEKIYENALAHELRKVGLLVSQQQNISVYYDRIIVGVYAADLLVENAVIVELKAVRTLEPIHKAQCLNYLKATGLPLCLLINFGTPRLEIRRVINTP